METGARRANPRDVRDLCAIYGLSDQAQVDDLMDLARLARLAREPGRWNQYDAVLSPYIGLEQAISAISLVAGKDVRHPASGGREWPFPE
jgi:hypothetical protein